MRDHCRLLQTQDPELRLSSGTVKIRARAGRAGRTGPGRTGPGRTGPGRTGPARTGTGR